MSNHKRLSMALCVAVLFFACDNSENPVGSAPDKTSKVDEITTNVVMLNETLIGTQAHLKKSAANATIRELVTFSDLASVGSSPAAVRDAFEKIYGKQPSGIAVNSETYFNAIVPAVTEQYGQPCYKEIGDASYTSMGSTNDGEVVIGNATAVNEGDDEANVTITTSGSWTKVTSWSVTHTFGLSFNASFGFAPVFSVGGSVSYSAAIGTGGSTSSQYSVSYAVTVKVPPHSKRSLTLITKMSKETMGYELPISISGYFGANFTDKVNDHFFWFQPAESILPMTSGTQSGKIDNVSRSDAYAIIHPAESIGT